MDRETVCTMFIHPDRGRMTMVDFWRCKEQRTADNLTSRHQMFSCRMAPPCDALFQRLRPVLPQEIAPIGLELVPPTNTFAVTHQNRLPLGVLATPPYGQQAGCRRCPYREVRSRPARTAATISFVLILMSTAGTSRGDPSLSCGRMRYLLPSRRRIRTSASSLAWSSRSARC